MLRAASCLSKPYLGRIGSGALSAVRPTRSAFPGRPRYCSFTVHFIKDEDGGSVAVKAKTGQTLLQVAHDHDIDIEGACGGECACSTCHVILEKEQFDKLPPPDDDEADMLDLAQDVTDTSRLGCQVILDKERDDGLRVRIPAGIVNLLK
mmetsp:Transcript_116652/g.277301  ORF Transcript_116652/g.277301 Transcript_116652/m.277301 type:complete len:150 (-) Transcript_116652:14-463(-)